MRIRTGHAPGAWSENVPVEHTPVRFRVSGALVTAQPAPLVGVTLTPKRRAQLDAAHERYKARHSIRPENRWTDEP